MDISLSKKINKSPMIKEKTFIKTVAVGEECQGLRLDQFLAQSRALKSRSQARRLISQQRVLLKDMPLKASARLKSGDILSLILTEKQSPGLEPCHRPLDILYEDEEILIVNKPAGLVTHPAPGHESETLINILFHQTRLSPGTHPLRPGVVHRLDRFASGLILLTKTKKSQDYFIEQFKKRHIKREYLALSLRPPVPPEGALDTWMGRHPVDRKRFVSSKDFRPGFKKALTFYKLLNADKNGLSLIKCSLGTGRTHQIRVHLSSLSCPLLGDTVYGGMKKLSVIKNPSLQRQLKNLSRLALHACRLRFRHPASGREISFHAPWPEDLKELLESLNFLGE